MKIIIKTKKIKENLKSNDEIITKIIRVFINHQDTTDIVTLKNNLKNLGIEPLEAVSYLFPDEQGKEKISGQLMSKVIELHNSMCRDPNNKRPDKEIKPDAFQNFPKVGVDSTKVPIGNKEIGIQDQEDTRKNKKNLKGGIREASDSEIEIDKYKFLFSRINKISSEQENNPKKYANVIEDFIKNNNSSYSDLYDKLDYFINNNIMSVTLLSNVTDAINDYTHYKDIESGQAWPKNKDSDIQPDDRSHLSIVKEKIIKFGIGPALRRK